MRVVVIGAGIMGSCLAFHVAQSKFLEVIVLDANEMENASVETAFGDDEILQATGEDTAATGKGFASPPPQLPSASLNSLGWINSFDKQPYAYSLLARMSTRMWKQFVHSLTPDETELAFETGRAAMWANTQGSGYALAHAAQTATELKNKADRVSAVALKENVGSLVSLRSAVECVVGQDDCVVDAGRASAKLLSKAQREFSERFFIFYGTLVTGFGTTAERKTRQPRSESPGMSDSSPLASPSAADIPLEEVEEDSDTEAGADDIFSGAESVTEVHTSKGTLPCDLVVLACGSATAEVAAAAGASIPVNSRTGLSILTEPLEGSSIFRASCCAMKFVDATRLLSDSPEEWEKAGQRVAEAFRKTAHHLHPPASSEQHLSNPFPPPSPYLDQALDTSPYTGAGKGDPGSPQLFASKRSLQLPRRVSAGGAGGEGEKEDIGPPPVCLFLRQLPCGRVHIGEAHLHPHTFESLQDEWKAQGVVEKAGGSSAIAGAVSSHRKQPKSKFPDAKPKERATFFRYIKEDARSEERRRNERAVEEKRKKSFPQPPPFHLPARVSSIDSLTALTRSSITQKVHIGTMDITASFKDVEKLAERIVGCLAEDIDSLKGKAFKTNLCETPIPVDGLPILGWAPQLGNMYVAVDYAGVTLAPIAGKLCASEIAAVGRRWVQQQQQQGRQGQQQTGASPGPPLPRAIARWSTSLEMLNPFRPMRFFK